MDHHRRGPVPGLWPRTRCGPSRPKATYGVDLCRNLEPLGFQPAVPWESIAEDPNACAYNGNPIGFSRGCFFNGSDGGPWWPAIFHELGHNSQSLVDRIMYGDLTYGAGLYGEGDANLLGRWSGQVLLADPTIQAATKASIRRQFDDNALTATNRLAQWEAQTT